MWPCLCLSILSIVLAGEVHSRRPDITWVSPQGGETYHPGDTLICSWRADRAVVSPSVRLCMFHDGQSGSDGDTDSDNDCGETVWPTVEKSGDKYTISLGVPNASAEGRYALRMKDDFGSIHDTPEFSLRAMPKAETDSTGSPSDNAQVPLSAPGETKPSDPSNAATSSSATAALTIGSTAAPVAYPADDTNPSATTSARAPPNSAEPNAQDAPVSNAPPASTSRAVNISSPSITPQDLASRRPPSTAAFAVPLSVIGTILVIAAGLAFRHHRSLGKQRTEDAEKLARSAGEVQHALGVHSRHEIGNGAVAVPTPLFMPVKRETRQLTRKGFSPTSLTPPARDTEYGNKKSRSRPLSTKLGLPPRNNVHTPAGANNPANLDGDPGTHLVIEDYISPSPPLPSSLLAASHRVHVRNEVPGICLFPNNRSYDDKPFPPSSRS